MHETLHTMIVRKYEGMLFNLYMKKAYDRIKCDVLDIKAIYI